MSNVPSFDHSGSNFDGFLEEDGLLDEVEMVAIKRVIAWKRLETMTSQHVAKEAAKP